MKVLVQEVVPVESSQPQGAAPWDTPAGGLISPDKALGAHGGPGARGDLGAGGPGQRRPPVRAHALLFMSVPGLACAGRAPWD